MVGIDLVDIPRFKKIISSNIGEKFINRTFFIDEIAQTNNKESNINLNNLACYYAAKEAVIKASNNELNISDVGKIKIIRKNSIELYAIVYKEDIMCNKYAISLSFNSEYAIAIAVNLSYEETR